jgi:hypothetical protein
LYSHLGIAIIERWSMSHSSAASEKIDTTDSPELHHFLHVASSEQERLLGIVFATIRHFWGDVRALFSGVVDGRAAGKLSIL